MSVKDDPSETLHLRYKLERGAWSLEECRAAAEEWGATDQLIWISMRRGPIPGKGSLSMQVLGLDGYSGRMPGPMEFFKALTAMAQFLANHPNAPSGVRTICEAFCDAIRESVVRGSSSN